MRNCDVCGGVTTWEEGTAYSADEFRTLVRLGFEPPSMVAMLGPSAIHGWKTGLVANSTTGWLLCPTCARRAANYLPKTHYNLPINNLVIRLVIIRAGKTHLPFECMEVYG